MSGDRIDDFAELLALVEAGAIEVVSARNVLTLAFDGRDALTVGGIGDLSGEDFLFS